MWTPFSFFKWKPTPCCIDMKLWRSRGSGHIYMGSGGGSWRLYRGDKVLGGGVIEVHISCKLCI